MFGVVAGVNYIDSAKNVQVNTHTLIPKIMKPLILSIEYLK